MLRNILRVMFIICITGFAMSGAHADEDEIAAILAMEKAPEGVVFEVVSGDETYIETALHDFKGYQRQLREKFPDIELAIVTHGSEQFALTSTKRDSYPEVHEQVQSIVADNVPVHICETHAGWRGITAEDFPDYVNVSAQGPVQIRQYQELGYLLVEL